MKVLTTVVQMAPVVLPALMVLLDVRANSAASAAGGADRVFAVVKGVVLTREVSGGHG